MFYPYAFDIVKVLKGKSGQKNRKEPNFNSTKNIQLHLKYIRF